MRSHLPRPSDTPPTSHFLKQAIGRPITPKLDPLPPRQTRIVKLNPLPPRQTRIVVPNHNPNLLPDLSAICAYYSQETGDLGSDHFPSEYGWAASHSGHVLVGPDSASEVGSDVGTDTGDNSDEGGVHTPALLKVLGRVRPYGLCCTPLGTAAHADGYVMDLADARYSLTIGSPDGRAFDGYFAQVTNNIHDMELYVVNTDYADNMRSSVQTTEHDQTIEFSSQVFPDPDHPGRSRDLPVFYPDGARVPADCVHETLSGAVVEVSFTFTHNFSEADECDKFDRYLHSIYIMALYV